MSALRVYLKPTAVAALLVGLGSGANGAYAQVSLRRGAPVPPVALAKRGDLLLGVGAGYEADVRAPLVAVDGDLTRVAVLHLLYAVADGVLIEVEGDAYRVLSVDRLGAPLIEPHESLIRGESRGSSDVRAAFAFRLLGGDQGLAVGGRFQFNIPGSDASKGLGTNSLFVRVGALGGYRRGPLVAMGELAIAILEAPVDNLEQNDVVAYSAELLYSTRRVLRLYLGVDGRASVRATVPPGTEDLGAARFGVDWRLGSWLLDLGGLVGYAGNSARWGVTGGAAFTLGRRRSQV